MLDGTHPEFPAPTANAQYILFTPDGMTVGGDGTSCVDYLAYHYFVPVPGSALHAAYALVPRCAGCGALSGVDELTDSGSRELVEAVPDPHFSDLRWS